MQIGTRRHLHALTKKNLSHYLFDVTTGNVHKKPQKRVNETQKNNPLFVNTLEQQFKYQVHTLHVSLYIFFFCVMKHHQFPPHQQNITEGYYRKKKL